MVGLLKKKTTRNDAIVEDLCGHGTSMAAVIAGPRNDDGLPVGVAYNSNLISYRANKDVLIFGRKDKKAVRDAFKELGDNDDVKVISISMGRLLGSRIISDAVKYAFFRGKLIFAAGGTSRVPIARRIVVFPARMEETIAVTGVRDISNRICNNCHSGRKIDFTAVMQRNKRKNRNRTSPIFGYYDNVKKYSGGSSTATAMVAGMATLVWSKNPTWSKDQVLKKLKESSEYYPNRDNRRGYGTIDAYIAVQ